jgi:hypothetical protein
LPRIAFAVAAALLLSPVAGFAKAPLGTAQNFLDRVDSLKKRGPMALFSGDIGRLKNEANAAGKSIANDRIAGAKVGRPALYCSPTPRASLGQNEFLAGLQAISPAERARLPLKDAMLRILQRKYPCSGRS